MNAAEETARTFKTAWFAKAARKARIADDELCEAIRAVQKGQADDLGGGVFKKRLDKNRQRSIIRQKGGASGFTPICSPRKIAPTSTIPNCGHFVILRTSMHGRRTIRLSGSWKRAS